MKRIIGIVIITLILLLGCLFLFQYNENKKVLANEIYTSKVTDKKISVPGKSKFIKEENFILKFNNSRNFKTVTKEVKEILASFETKACGEYYDSTQDIVILEYIVTNQFLMNTITIKYKIGMECGV